MFIIIKKSNILFFSVDSKQIICYGIHNINFMSVNINFNETSNETKWNSIKNGDFAVIQGNTSHPIPSNLYRIFTVLDDETDQKVSFILLPMFDGPFQQNMFPYLIPTSAAPPIISKMIHKISINAETSQ